MYSTMANAPALAALKFVSRLPNPSSGRLSSLPRAVGILSSSSVRARVIHSYPQDAARRGRQPIARPLRMSSSNFNPPFFASVAGNQATADATDTKWTPPSEKSLAERPVLIVGAGNLGRRIGMVWASASHPVTLLDDSPDALRDATEYITDNLGEYCLSRGTLPGHVCTTTDLRVATTTGRYEGDSSSSLDAGTNTTTTTTTTTAAAAATLGPWMAIDCLPESLELKMTVLSQLERLLPDPNCILASNSSSLQTSEMAPALRHPERLLNTHYFIPPRNRMVELMSSSHTHAAIFPFLADQMRGVGLTPLVVPAGVLSQGFIFNRIWAACKRETLGVLSEGVAQPADIDALFRDFFHAEKGPCERMDEIGLDTIAKIEAHYLELRPDLRDMGIQEPLDWLRIYYLEQHRLGEKSGDGLFTKEEREELNERHRMLRHRVVEETTDA